MPEIPGLPADVFFGSPDQPLPDWRRAKGKTAESDDDDSPQPGVVEMLGFDPAELDE